MSARRGVLAEAERTPAPQEEDEGSDEDFVATDELSCSSSSSSDEEEPERGYHASQVDSIEYLAAVLEVEDPGGLPLVEDELSDSSEEEDEASDEEEEGIQGRGGRGGKHGTLKENDKAAQQHANGGTAGQQGHHTPQQSQPPAQPSVLGVAQPAILGQASDAGGRQGLGNGVPGVQGEGAQPNWLVDLDELMANNGSGHQTPEAHVHEGCVHHTMYNTRARVDLRDVTIEQLEVALPDDWMEDTYRMADDEKEYERFLMALHNDNPDHEFPEDDDDVEFSAHLRELEGDEGEDDTGSLVQASGMGGDGDFDSSHGDTPGTCHNAAHHKQRKRYTRRELPLRQARQHMVRAIEENVPDDQLRTLHLQLYMHSQLLFQLHTLTARDPAPGAQQLAAKAWKMLQELDCTRRAGIAYANSCGRPPYNPHVLGMQDAGTGGSSGSGLGGTSAGFGSQGMQGGLLAMEEGQAVWAPPLRQDVRCIMDVSPLRNITNYCTALSFMPMQPVSAWEAIEQLGQGTAVERKRVRRKQTSHPLMVLWRDVSEPVLSVAFPLLLDKTLHYVTAPTVPANYWSPGEDELLATGIARYGNNWAVIAEMLLPNKTNIQVRVRHKNVLARQKNAVITNIRTLVRGPLTAEEIHRIDVGLGLLSRTPSPLVTIPLRHILAMRLDAHGTPLPRTEADGQWGETKGPEVVAAMAAGAIVAAADAAGIGGALPTPGMGTITAMGDQAQAAGKDPAVGDNVDGAAADVGDAAQRPPRRASALLAAAVNRLASTVKSNEAGTVLEKEDFYTLPVPVADVWTQLTEMFVPHRQPSALFKLWLEHLVAVKTARKQQQQQQENTNTAAAQQPQQAAAGMAAASANSQPGRELGGQLTKNPGRVEIPTPTAAPAAAPAATPAAAPVASPIASPETSTATIAAQAAPDAKTADAAAMAAALAAAAVVAAASAAHPNTSAAAVGAADPPQSEGAIPRNILLLAPAPSSAGAAAGAAQSEVVIPPLTLFPPSAPMPTSAKEVGAMMSKHLESLQGIQAYRENYRKAERARRDALQHHLQQRHQAQIAFIQALAAKNNAQLTTTNNAQLLGPAADSAGLAAPAAPAGNAEQQGDGDTDQQPAQPQPAVQPAVLAVPPPDMGVIAATMWAGGRARINAGGQIALEGMYAPNAALAVLATVAQVAAGLEGAGLRCDDIPPELLPSKKRIRKKPAKLGDTTARGAEDKRVAGAEGSGLQQQGAGVQGAAEAQGTGAPGSDGGDDDMDLTTLMNAAVAAKDAQGADKAITVNGMIPVHALQPLAPQKFQQQQGYGQEAAGVDKRGGRAPAKRVSRGTSNAQGGSAAGGAKPLAMALSGSGVAAPAPRTALVDVGVRETVASDTTTTGPRAGTKRSRPLPGASPPLPATRSSQRRRLAVNTTTVANTTTAATTNTAPTARTDASAMRSNDAHGTHAGPLTILARQVLSPLQEDVGNNAQPQGPPPPRSSLRGSSLLGPARNVMAGARRRGVNANRTYVQGRGAQQVQDAAVGTKGGRQTGNGKGTTTVRREPWPGMVAPWEDNQAGQHPTPHLDDLPDSDHSSDTETE